MTAAGWFALRGITLALAWFCLLNVAAGLVVTLAAGPLAANARRRTASLWFGLRVFASGAALAFVAGIFLPSYWLYEPRDVIEGFDVLLTVGALVTCLAVGAGVVRGVSAWRSAAGRTRAWMRRARPLSEPHPHSRFSERSPSAQPSRSVSSVSTGQAKPDPVP